MLSHFPTHQPWLMALWLGSSCCCCSCLAKYTHYYDGSCSHTNLICYFIGKGCACKPITCMHVTAKLSVSLSHRLVYICMCNGSVWCAPRKFQYFPRLLRRKIKYSMEAEWRPKFLAWQSHQSFQLYVLLFTSPSSACVLLLFIPSFLLTHGPEDLEDDNWVD